MPNFALTKIVASKTVPSRNPTCAAPACSLTLAAGRSVLLIHALLMNAATTTPLAIPFPLVAQAPRRLLTIQLT